MEITVGTFNLNNLFSRFNFEAKVEEISEDERDVTVFFEFDEEGDFRFREFAAGRRSVLIHPRLLSTGRTAKGFGGTSVGHFQSIGAVAASHGCCASRSLKRLDPHLTGLLLAPLTPTRSSIWES
jgi:hypothetical protein